MGMCGKVRFSASACGLHTHTHIHTVMQWREHQSRPSPSVCDRRIRSYRSSYTHKRPLTMFQKNSFTCPSHTISLQKYRLHNHWTSQGVFTLGWFQGAESVYKKSGLHANQVQFIYIALFTIHCFKSTFTENQWTIFQNEVSLYLTLEKYLNKFRGKTRL